MSIAVFFNVKTARSFTRGFTSRNSDVMRAAFLRLLLNITLLYGTRTLIVHLINLLENVQRKFT
jgi:hypothetical protein